MNKYIFNNHLNDYWEKIPAGNSRSIKKDYFSKTSNSNHSFSANLYKHNQLNVNQL